MHCLIGSQQSDTNWSSHCVVFWLLIIVIVDGDGDDVSFVAALMLEY